MVCVPRYWTRDWHYKFYMGPKAKIAIKSDQEDISKLQFFYDQKARLDNLDAPYRSKCLSSAEQDYGEGIDKPNSEKFMDAQKTRYFAWRTFVEEKIPEEKFRV